MLINRRDFVKQAAVASSFTIPASGTAHARDQAPAASPMPLKIGMTDWNLGQRGDITKIALARQIGLDGIQVSLQFPTDDKPSPSTAGDAGGVQTGGARERHSDLFSGDRQPGKVAAAAPHQSGGGDPARRGRRGRAQPRDQQHPAADPRRQPHQHAERAGGEHVRRHDERGRALRRKGWCRRRPGRLDLGRGQPPSARCDRVGLSSASTTTRGTSSHD